LKTQKIGLSRANINCFEYKILVDIDLPSKTVLSLEWRQQRRLAVTWQKGEIFGFEN
jgi:hypothetical protein